MNARFHVPGTYGPGDLVVLPEDEAQHLTRVLRLGVGAAVRVFDGHGREHAAVVESATRGNVQVRVGEAVAPAVEARIAITLAAAVLKGDRMDDVVRDAVMMGVAAIQPVLTERTEVSASALTRGHRHDRWQRVSVSAAKQCGRAVVPHVFSPVDFQQLLVVLAAGALPKPAFMLAEPGAAVDAAPLRDLVDQRPPRATVLIGPEGGWTQEEVDRAQAHCRLVSMGGRTIRADAMGVAALAALYAVWGEY